MDGTREDDPTTRFYADNAETYADYALSPTGRRLEQFLGHLAFDAQILELGCGNGRDSGAMIARGFRVTPTDGVPEMAGEAARRLGVPVPVLRFEDLDVVAAFDGIWAHACLLHVPRQELGGILARIHRALRRGGVFYASYKAGETEGHDSLGRYYNYPSRAWLQTLYAGLPWASVEISENTGGGYDDQPTDWLHVTVVKM